MDWASLNAFLLLIFLTEAVVLDVETSAAELLKIFDAKIKQCGSEAADETSDRKYRNKDESGEDEEKTNNKKYRNTAESPETDSIASNGDDVLDFLQSVAVKAPRVSASPLSLRADKRHWSTQNIYPPIHPPHCRA